MLKFSVDGTLVPAISHTVYVLKTLVRTRRIEEHVLEHNDKLSYLILWWMTA